MGYPMSYVRLVRRNSLGGPGYTHPCPMSGMDIECAKSLIIGDMRRFELDQQDEVHLKMYADKSGATVEQVKKIFEILFDDECRPFIEP